MEFLQQQAAGLRLFWRQDLRRRLPASALLLLLSFFLGLGGMLLYPETGEKIIAGFVEMVTESGVTDEEGTLSFLGILRNNWTAMLFIVGYGIFPFLCLPAVSLFLNGALIGVMIGYFHLQGLPALAAVMGILPHGIFELPALVIAGAMGLHLCRRITGVLLHREPAHDLLPLAEDLLRVLLLVLFPLLLAAALVECYVTPQIMALFL